uniref:Large ribosomal subunit protein bL9c n=1 Tax=Thuretia quercifolia TaxID=189650 RepID=A0A1Z1ML83_9FLOR|nr:ribosomal protein L9 [Thuretia quercifolia]ARW66504.1 ribosomal protein L9 [Thuretia quercifolia]
MRKKIKIILKEDYLNIGKKNTIDNVSKGYAFNFLIPNNIAEIATKNKIKHLKMFDSIKQKQIEDNKTRAEKLQKTFILIKKINLLKKAGENKLIFGSINEKEVINIILKQTNIKLDKKQIKIPSIKQIGVFSIEINLFYSIYCKLKLNIIPANI